MAEPSGRIVRQSRKFTNERRLTGVYIHLGNGVIVNSSDVIAIMDLESTSMSANTREFLKIVEEEGFVRSVSDEIPKTFIVCEIDGQSVVYISNISSRALMGRTEKYK